MPDRLAEFQPAHNPPAFPDFYQRLVLGGCNATLGQPKSVHIVFGFNALERSNFVVVIKK
jgi:hypothetical protein